MKNSARVVEVKSAENPVEVSKKLRGNDPVVMEFAVKVLVIPSLKIADLKADFVSNHDVGLKVVL